MWLCMDIIDRITEYCSENKNIKAVELGNLGDYTCRNTLRMLNLNQSLILHRVCLWKDSIYNADTWDEEGEKSLKLFRDRRQLINGLFDESSYSFVDSSLNFVFFSSDYPKVNDLLLWIPKVIDNGIIFGSFINNGIIKEIKSLFGDGIKIDEFDDKSWKLFGINNEVRKLAIKNSKREGDWNESGYFESNNAELRPF